jgi:hypothetical protein
MALAQAAEPAAGVAEASAALTRPPRARPPDRTAAIVAELIDRQHLGSAERRALASLAVIDAAGHIGLITK